MSTELLTTAVDCFWLFFGGVLVFFMQTGFTMVEAGFTRSKNTGNIIMKNIVDFMFGSIIYWFIGYGLMYGEGNGFIGIPFGDMFMNGMAGAENMDYTALFFQTVFCATSATIVSGAMAERTNFKAYCIYSAAISLFIYPIAGHWVWGGGWLSELGFHDFAGSAIVHMLGGTLSFVGAAILGPRIGKYTKDGKVNVIPGHNILIGALGVLILCLVAITAPCDLVTPFASIIIGVVGAILMCLAIPFIDTKLKVDDPVGAISVHGICGLWGTIAVGLFASDTSAGAELLGLFYGGGLKALGVQALGAVSLIAWAAIVGSILFVVLKKAGLLRAKPQEEIEGLDSTEHGLASAYPDFVVSYNEKRSM